MKVAKKQTRERIVDTADTLFYENGFDTTSFADIADAVGISRGNFYHHFRTKDDILDAVIARRMRATEDLLEGWETQAASPLERIRLFIRILITNQTKIMAFGCPVGTLCAELAKLEHAAHERATNIFSLFRDWLTGQFRALGGRLEAEDLALHVLARSQGIAALAAAYRNERFVKKEVSALEEWLDSLPAKQI